MINVGLEVSSTLTDNPTGVQRYMDGVISGLMYENGVSLRRLFKLSRFRKRHLMPSLSVPHRWYGVSPVEWRDGIDVIHCLDTTVPARSGGRPIVVTIHDLYLALHADYLDLKTVRKKRKKVSDACRKASHIVVPTNAIKRELIEAFDVKKPISAIPHGVRPDFSDRSLENREERRYILGFSGGVRKNFTLLAEAFYKSRAYELGWHLTIVGRPSEEELSRVLGFLPTERLNIREQLDDEDLMDLYGNAGVVSYVSHYEGFGFPVIEGMSASVPVVTGQHGATAEVAGGHAYLVDTHSSDSIKTGLDHAVFMGSDDVDKAKKHATSYTWKHVGQELKGVYDSVMYSG